MTDDFLKTKNRIHFSSLAMENKTFDKYDIEQLGVLYKRNFINSLSGYRSVNLIGTVNKKQISNLAIFNTIFHVSSNPPLIGMLCRPPVVTRHTLNNILETGYYTINHIRPQFFNKAHQTAAKYDNDLSEFEMVGLNRYFSANCPAPYVSESSVKIGLKLNEDYTIKSNGSVLIIGEVIEVILPANAVLSDGLIDLGLTETITGSGLDTYYTTRKIARLSFARPDKDLDIIG